MQESHKQIIGTSRLSFFLRCVSFLAPVLFSIAVHAQPANVLLDRAFWKTQPSLQEVQAKIEEGNDPAELNRFAFDPLVYALLERAPMETLEFLLSQKGNEVNKITHDGRTYIFWAAYKDNLPFMRYLIARGAVTDIVDEHGYSLLNFSAVTGQQNPELYDFIFAHGARVKEEKNREGANAQLLLLPHLKDAKMIRYFEAKGLALSDVDKKGSGAFHYAARGGQIDMLDWLIKEGVAYNTTSENGRNAMHFASEGLRGYNNTLNVFEYLESKGIAPDAITKSGKSPLMLYAPDGEDARVIEYFLNKGASPDQADEEGNTALMYAAKYNGVEIVSPLVHNTKDINAANKKGQTALTHAVQRNTAEIVAQLIAKGARVNVVDEEGNNLVYYLVQSYNPRKPAAFNEKLAILERNGLALTTPQSNGNTFFHLAAQQNRLELLKKAHETGLDVNAKNKEGLTPLHIAAMKASNDETLKYLVAAGADKSILTAFEESVYQLASENEILRKKQVDLKFLED